MIRRRRRRLATFGMVAAVFALVSADLAAADPFNAWSGKKGPYAWEARRLGCGVVGQNPASSARTRAGARARPTDSCGSPSRGRSGTRPRSEWATVQRQRRSTEEHSPRRRRGVVHWNQWFFPFADEAGAVSRHIVVFEWFRDLPGAAADRRALRRERTFGPASSSRASPLNDERAARRRPSQDKPAATYSPGRLPSEYHRRWRA